MRRYDFIIAYDIADAKRLRKIAKVLQQRAIRIQYSIFLLKGTTRDEIDSLVKEILDLCDHDEDDIRVYKIKNYGLYFGSAMNLKEPLIHAGGLFEHL